MPTYEYKCSACGHAFERFHSITAAPIKRCPECGKAKVKRLLGTGVGLIFKGSGFYITDYRSDSYKDAAKAESAKTEPAKAEGGGSESKGDEKSTAAESKPAATSESKSTGSGESKSASKSEAPKSSKKK